VTGAHFTDRNVDERIGDVLSTYRARRLRMGWWVTPTSSPADLVPRLVAQGLEVDEAEPGMSCDLSTWAPPPTSDGVEVRRVDDRASFHDWCDVFVRGMWMDGDGAGPYERCFADVSIGANARYRSYLAYRDGRAISSAFGVRSGDVVGVYAVATLPEARRLGAGTAITARVVTDAKAEGARRAILSASHDGLRVYERLGFRTVCEIFVAGVAFDGS
jgi:GNAT superfamily N-acetyltransferase